MGTRVVLSLVLALMAGCGTLPADDCRACASPDEGWAAVPAPSNALELLSPVDQRHADDVRWYQAPSGALRACALKECGGVVYEFHQVDGEWVGGPDVLRHCHVRTGS